MNFKDTVSFLKENLPSVIVTSIVLGGAFIAYNTKEMNKMKLAHKEEFDKIIVRQEVLEKDLADFENLYRKCISNTKIETTADDFNDLFNEPD